MALATGQITINNIEETISVVFSKDNHVFPGGVSSALAGSVDINVKAYIGTEEVAYTFGSVTPATPTGLTITPSSANKKITLTATTSLTQASGTYNVQVVVRGVTITKTLSYTISFEGAPGKGISSTEITYQAHTNGTIAPTGTWLTSPPEVADHLFLWTRTIITYTDNTTSTSYSVGKMGRGTDGTDGIDGADAKLATIVASSKIFKSRDGGATFSPNSITLTPVFQGGVTYLNWQYSTNGGSTWTTVTTQNGLSVNSTTKVLTISKTSTLFTTLITDIVFRVNTNDSTVYDTVNITKIYDVVDLTQQDIFNKLTNNGAEQGLFLDTGKLYLNGEYLRTSNLVAGDALIENGFINTAVIKDASITSAKIDSLDANKIVAKSITTNQLSSEVGQNLDLSSNTSITLKVVDEVTEQIGAAPIYTWIKYADNAQGTGITDNPTGKTYIGIASGKTTATESNDPAAYTWSKFEGPPGDDGQTTYTWVKYADTDTGSGMSDNPTGKRFLGLAHNKTTATKSTNAADYQWSPLYDNVQVGGRNLIKNTDMGGETFRYDHVNKIGEGGYNIGTRLGFVETPKALEQYTISLNLRGTGRDIVVYLISASGNTATTIATQAQMSTTVFNKFSLTFTAPAADISNILVYTQYRSTVYTAWFEIEPNSLKLEKGNVATDWTPAPEDIKEKVTTLSASVDVLAGEVNLKASKTEVTNETKNLVASSIVEYYLSTSSISPTGGSWSETAPAWVNGHFMWSRTKVTTKAGTVTYYPNANGTNITGATGATGDDGADGRGITSITPQYYLSTSNTAQMNGSWGTEPPAFDKAKYLWTRSYIEWNNPTGTSTTTPVLSTEWNTLADHEVRVYNAEQKITPEAIESTVSERTDVNGDPLFAKTSVMKQTVDSVRIAFENQVLGGQNLIRESHMLSDKFETYQGSTITSIRDNVSMPEWGTESATLIQTSSLGTNALKARWVISDDLTFMAGKPMVFSVYAKNNRSDQPVTISTNRIGEPITLAKGEMRKLEFLGVRPENEGRFLILELMAPTAAYYLSVTLFHPKWELGDKPTEWSPHPEELYAGYTKINKDGVEVSRSDTDIKSKLAYDGITVTNGTDNIAVFGETTYMPYANIDTIDSLDVVGTVRERISLQIGEGKDYTTVSEALDTIFKDGRTTLLYDTDINLYLNGNITDEVILKGIEGNGRINIWFKSGAKLYGRIWARDCKVRVYIRSEVTAGSGRGLVKNTSSEVRAIWNESSSYVNVISVDVDGGGKLHGIIGNDAGVTSIQDCDVSNCGNAITSNFGSDVRVMNCKGSNNSRSLRIQTNAVMYVTGTYPDAGASSALVMDAFYIKNGTPTATPSSFVAPPVTDKPFSKTFAPSYLKTQTPDGKWSTYYGDKAAQNRWESSSPYATGFAAFGSDVKAYIDDRKAGTTPTIEIRLRRSAVAHGSSNAIPPDPNNFEPTTSFTGATRGAWTNWAKVPMSLFTTSGFTFKFGTSKTDVSYNPYRYYAIWDKCEVRVSKIKSV